MLKQACYNLVISIWANIFVYKVSRTISFHYYVPRYHEWWQFTNWFLILVQFNTFLLPGHSVQWAAFVIMDPIIMNDSSTAFLFLYSLTLSRMRKSLWTFSSILYCIK